MRKWVGYATVLATASGVFGGCTQSEPEASGAGGASNGRGARIRV